MSYINIKGGSDAAYFADVQSDVLEIKGELRGKEKKSRATFSLLCLPPSPPPHFQHHVVRLTNDGAQSKRLLGFRPLAHYHEKNRDRGQCRWRPIQTLLKMMHGWRSICEGTVAWVWVKTLRDPGEDTEYGMRNGQKETHSGKERGAGISRESWTLHDLMATCRKCLLLYGFLSVLGRRKKTWALPPFHLAFPAPQAPLSHSFNPVIFTPDLPKSPHKWACRRNCRNMTDNALQEWCLSPPPTLCSGLLLPCASSLKQNQQVKAGNWLLTF